MLYSRIFFLMRRRPPRSTRTYTLFPYTTLFRSLEQSVAARRLEIILALGRRAGDQFDLPRVEPEPGISGLRLRLDRAVVRQQYALRTALDDRGSNRALGDEIGSASCRARVCQAV